MNANPVANAPRWRSCGAEVSGKYCSNCAETTSLHVPSAGEFLHEFVGHFVALEGKLWKTLKQLISRPGQLTVDFLAGRRVLSIAPLRLYLTMSLVFFALIKIFGIELPHITVDKNSIGATYSQSRQNASDQLGTATFRLNVYGDLTAGKPSEMPVRDQICSSTDGVGKISHKWVGNLKQFMSESDEAKGDVLNHGFLANLPYMLIGTLPLFALYLKLVYRRFGRRYGEHLVFALHANAFAFLLSSLMIVVPGSVAWVVICAGKGLFPLISAWDCLQLVAFPCLVAYLPKAMRRIYGGSRGGHVRPLIAAYFRTSNRRVECDGYRRIYRHRWPRIGIEQLHRVDKRTRAEPLAP